MAWGVQWSTVISTNRNARFWRHAVISACRLKPVCDRLQETLYLFFWLFLWQLCRFGYSLEMATLPGNPTTPEASASESSVPESSPTPPRTTNSSSANLAGSESDTEQVERPQHYSESTTVFSTPSSSQSGSPESASRPKGRKRVRQVPKWKSTLKKERRNTGESYVTKKGKAVSMHELTMFKE